MIAMVLEVSQKSMAGDHHSLVEVDKAAEMVIEWAGVAKAGAGWIHRWCRIDEEAP